jgi:hypothetical protein
MCLPFLLTAKPPKPEQCDWPARVLSEFNTFALSQEMPQRLTQSMYIQPQTLKLPSTAIFASAYALSTAESVPRSGDVLRRTEDMSRETATIFGRGTILEPSTSHIGQGVALVAQTAAFVYIYVRIPQIVEMTLSLHATRYLWAGKHRLLLCDTQERCTLHGEWLIRPNVK